MLKKSVALPIALVLLTLLSGTALAESACISPLLAAASRGDTDAVRGLLDGGADPNQTDCIGTTPLAYAAQGGFVDIVKILLAHGADLNKSSKFGWTPLGLAASGNHPDVVKILLTHGANLDMTTAAGYTLLEVAKGESKDLIRKALEQRAR
ncbi:MAG: ankyrin repeat domain-containing protein [Sulfobacillus sp.]